MRLVIALLSILALGLSACGPEPTISPYVPPDPRIRNLYFRVPDIESCYPGSLRDTEISKALSAVNALRDRHFLKSVTNRSDDATQPIGVALAVAASGTLAIPPALCASSDLPTWMSLCLAAIDSIPVTGRVPTSADLVERMFAQAGTDGRSTLLDPFLPYVSFGRVDNAPSGSAGVCAAALKIRYVDVQNLHGSQLRFVAYPYELYPTRLFDTTAEMFFHAIISVNSPENRTADVQSAVVTVTRDGVPIPVQVTLRRDTPNLIAWRARLQPSTRYWVKVEGIVINEVQQSYEYWVELAN